MTAVALVTLRVPTRLSSLKSLCAVFHPQVCDTRCPLRAQAQAVPRFACVVNSPWEVVGVCPVRVWEQEGVKVGAPGSQWVPGSELG